MSKTGTRCRDGFEYEFAGVQFRGAFGKVEHLDADNMVVRVVIDDDAGRNLFGFQYLGIVEGEVQGIGFMINLQSHNATFIVCRAFRFENSGKRNVLRVHFVLNVFVQESIEQEDPGWRRIYRERGQSSSVAKRQLFLRRDTILNSHHVWRIILVAKILVRIRVYERLQSLP